MVQSTNGEVLLTDYSWIALDWHLRRRPPLTVWVFPTRAAALAVVDEWPDGRDWQTIVRIR